MSVAATATATATATARPMATVSQTGLVHDAGTSSPRPTSS
jgi:hypothetical protein